MKNNGRTRVGVVARDPLRLLGLETILQETVGLAALGVTLEYAIADKALSALVIDDRSCGPLGVTEVVGRLRAERPDMKIVVVGASTDAEYMQAVIGAGAKGYLLETAGEREIRMAMDVVLDGSVWAPRKVLARLIDANGNTTASGSGAGAAEKLEKKLTPRELDVLQLLMDGRSNREIAKSMGIDEVTVKAHLGRMLRKSGASNRVELTLRALEEKPGRAGQRLAQRAG